MIVLSLLAGPAHAAKDRNGKKVREQNVEELYRQGLRAMKRGYYTRALEKFRKVRRKLGIISTFTLMGERAQTPARASILEDVVEAMGSTSRS